jgi:hypothetical protein
VTCQEYNILTGPDKNPADYTAAECAAAIKHLTECETCYQASFEFAMNDPNFPEIAMLAIMRAEHFKHDPEYTAIVDPAIANFGGFM